MRLLMSVFIFVFISIASTYSFHSVNAQEPVDALSDLVGAKAGQAENAVKNRGYTWVKTDKSGGSAYSYWRESGSNKCVTIRTADGRYQSIVYAPDFDCQDGSTDQAAQDTDTVPGLSDLVGAKAGQAENTVKDRGYTWVKTDKSGGSSYSYWRESGSNKCVTIRTADGRYQSIIYAPDFDCKTNAAKKPAAVSVTVEGNCRLYNEKSDNYRYEGSCEIEQGKSGGKNEYVITLGNGETYRFVDQGGKYKVHMRQGWSDHLATMTDMGNVATFEWYKWKLTAEQK